MNHLEEALDLAARGWGATSPNPAVGAVVVRDGEVVGRGFHTWAGLKHAEVLALEEAGETERAARPCTSPSNLLRTTAARRLASTRSWRQACEKWSRAMEDPNPLVRGRGFAQSAGRGHRSGDGRAIRRRAGELNEPSFTSCAPDVRW